MGIRIPTQDKGKARSNAIDRQIEEESRNARTVCMLLLGSDVESSRIVKRMKIHHGWTKDELMQYRLLIYQNSLDSAQALVRAICEMGVEYGDPTNHAQADHILDYRIQHGSSFLFSPEIAKAIHCVWQDPIIQTVMDRRNEFYLGDNAEYFFDEILRIGSPGYLPADGDILRARPQWSRAVETRFTFGVLQATIVDLGRLCSPKRMHYMENIAYIIFCASLSDYDQVLQGDDSENQLRDSLIVFESIVNSRRFTHTSVILLLTNIDLFVDKLSKVPLEKYFPDYTGGADAIKAIMYIRTRFMQVNRAGLATYIIHHRAANTTTESIHTILKNSILEDAWKKFRKAPSCSAALRLRRMLSSPRSQQSHLGILRTVVHRFEFSRFRKHLSTPGVAQVVKGVYDQAKDSLTRLWRLHLDSDEHGWFVCTSTGDMISL